MSNFIRNRQFYRNLLTISVPIALQNLLVQANSIMDTIMIGKADAGGVLLSSCSLANQPFFVLTMVCFGLSGGASVLNSQYFGKGDFQSIHTVMSMVLKVAAVIGAFFGGMAVFFPEFVMGLYSNQGIVIQNGAAYLRIVGCAYLFFAVGNTLLCMLRGIEIVKISVLVNGLSFVTNVFFNYALIFGHFGFPALGLKGAAIATLIARLLEFAIIFIYVFFFDRKLALRLKHLLLFHKTLARDLLSYGTPVLVNEMMWAVAISFQASILGHITYAAGDPVAANTITGIVQQLVSVVIFGVSTAAAVMVGKAIGENDHAEARRRAYTLKILSFALGVVSCIVILLIKPLVLGLYDLPEATIQLTNQLVNVIAVNTIFVSVSSVSIVGILRGAGDTRFCLLAEIICLWGIAIPIAFLLARFGFPVPVVLFFMKIDEVIKSIACLFRLKRGTWLKSLTREFAGRA